MKTSILMALLKDIVSSQKGGDIAYLKSYSSVSDETVMKDIRAITNTMEGKQATVSKELGEILLILANSSCTGESTLENKYGFISSQTSTRKAKDMLRAMLKSIVAHYEDIIIETAVELTETARKEMRIQLLDRHPLSCPRFTTSPLILGGARMFLGGVLYDASWRGEVSKLFTSLSVS